MLIHYSASQNNLQFSKQLQQQNEVTNGATEWFIQQRI